MALTCYCSIVGFDCFYNVLICKSLWIKVSAKLLNKYVQLYPLKQTPEKMLSIIWGKNLMDFRGPNKCNFSLIICC